jgi:hypothetical protein
MHIAQLKGTSLRQKKRPKDGRNLPKNGLKRDIWVLTGASAL